MHLSLSFLLHDIAYSVVRILQRRDVGLVMGEEVVVVVGSRANPWSSPRHYNNISLSLSLLEKRMTGAWTPTIDFCIRTARSQQEQRVLATALVLFHCLMEKHALMTCCPSGRNIPLFT
jgi:hypothetical protein